MTRARAALGASIVLALTTAARAEKVRHHMMIGAGAAFGDHRAGANLRLEGRFEGKSFDGREGFVLQSRFGVDLWAGAGEAWGVAFPLGVQVGGQAGDARMTVGGGLGFWTFTENGLGLAPYASSSLEIRRAPLRLSLDVRLARQVLLGTRDFNTYSVLLMVGWR